MKWSKNVNYMSKNAHKKIGLSYRNSMYLNVNQMSHYYKTSIRSIVEYASVVFDGLALSDCIKLENVQRRAARVCTGAMRRTELKIMLSDLEWETLKDRRNKAKLSMLFKIKNALVPNYLVNLLPGGNPPSTQYDLRRHVNTVRPKVRLRCYDQFFYSVFCFIVESAACWYCNVN